VEFTRSQRAPGCSSLC